MLVSLRIRTYSPINVCGTPPALTLSTPRNHLISLWIEYGILTKYISRRFPIYSFRKMRFWSWDCIFGIVQSQFFSPIGFKHAVGDFIPAQPYETWCLRPGCSMIPKFKWVCCRLPYSRTPMISTIKGIKNKVHLIPLNNELTAI
jgi:hypothetical protein